MTANFFCLTTDSGFDECWECGGSATLGGSQRAYVLSSGGRFCSRDCRLSFARRTQRERARRDALCNVCDSPPGECVTEFLDVDQVTITPWPHEYVPRRVTPQFIFAEAPDA